MNTGCVLLKLGRTEYNTPLRHVQFACTWLRGVGKKVYQKNQPGHKRVPAENEQFFLWLYVANCLIPTYCFLQAEDGSQLG